MFIDSSEDGDTNIDKVEEGEIGRLGR